MPTTSIGDLIVQLTDDHARLRQMFGAFWTADRSSWPDKFLELTETVVRHEVAEEQVVYPEVRKAVEDGDRVAELRIAEQSEAELLLAEMEAFLPSDEKFRSSLQKLEKLVLEHAKHEERSIFQPLREALGQQRLDDLGVRYARAKSSAPTHPHPNVPDGPPGNLLLGPVASLIDRVRDAVKKSSGGGS
jgi:hemerythrin superfamily protein